MKARDAQEVYALLEMEAQAHGWPAHYAGDLTFHDCFAVRRLAGEPFLWILRECGTHIYALTRPGGEPCGTPFDPTWSARRFVTYMRGDDAKRLYYVDPCAEQCLTFVAPGQEWLIWEQLAA